LANKILNIKTNKLKNIQRVAKQILCEIKLPSSIIFEGDLASGKTTLIRELAYCLRIDKIKVSSPTFTLVNEYKGKLKGNLLNFNHFDLYRIEDVSELVELPLDFFYNKNYLNCFEWGKRFIHTIYEYSERLYLISITRESHTENEENRIFELYSIDEIDL